MPSAGNHILHAVMNPSSPWSLHFNRWLGLTGHLIQPFTVIWMAAIIQTAFVCNRWTVNIRIKESLSITRLVKIQRRCNYSAAWCTSILVFLSPRRWARGEGQQVTQKENNQKRYNEWCQLTVIDRQVPGQVIQSLPWCWWWWWWCATLTDNTTRRMLSVTPIAISDATFPEPVIQLPADRASGNGRWTRQTKVQTDWLTDSRRSR